MEYIFEAKINTEDRNKLPDSAFGLPSKRKYPLTDAEGKLDKKHILQAVRFFNKADDDDKPELAKNILKAAKELDMDYSNWKDVLEAAGEKVVKEYSSYGDDDDDADYEEREPDDCYCESDKERVNDKGEIVPDKCTKCDSPIEIYLKGEPVYLCSNKKCGKYYGTVPCNINESHQMSETQAFYKRWFDSKAKEDLDKAKNIAKQIHEKYESDKQPPCGNQNCMLCTMCAEAQFRGINVLPRPVYSPRDPVLNILGESIVKNPIHKSIKSGFDDMLDLATEPRDARWYCHVKWKNGNGGHEFLLLNINQHLYVMDAQQGIVTLNIESEYFKDIDYSESYICRLDNCELNESLLNEMNDPKNTLPWNAVLDIPFMLNEGMLTEEEAEEYWQEHPDERPVQEFKMILNSNDSRIPKLMCEGWKIAGTTINNEYILIQEGYDDISLHVSLVPATMSDVPNMEEWEYECMKNAYPNREIPESEVDKLKTELHQDAIDSVHKTRMIQYDYETIGMLTAYKVLDDQYWFIAEIYLIEEYRGKGIAKYILKNEIDQHDKLILNVYQNNKHAIELYESLGFEITQDGDGRFIMELDKTKRKTKYQPSNVFTLDEYKRANKYRSVIVGEIHNSSMLKYYDKLLSERKPEYFISEFAHEDRVLSLPELKQKLDMATNGEFKPGIPDYQDNYAIYKLAYDHGCKLIGCDLNNGKHYNRMHDEDHEREAYMLKVLEEFENTKFVCQLGDHHLRSIPITKEFLDYCGDTKDDRGIVSDLTVDNASPIWVHFTHEPKDVAILREPNELKNELDFINQQTIQEGYWQDIKNGVNPKKSPEGK